nr:hypothetical protein [Tanacetum cinerariifolium]
MLLLLVQEKMTNLTVEERFAFNVSLRMFMRSIVIQRPVEDLQLGVKSYQKKLNLTKPGTYKYDLKRKEAYTAYSNPRGFIYQNKDKQNRTLKMEVKGAYGCILELSAKQAFWFLISNPSIESSNKPPIKVEVPSELPKVSLVNASLKKLKFHFAQFDYVAKKMTTPNARIEEQIMSQDALLTVINSMSLIGEFMNMERMGNESYDKCFNLDAELLKSQNAHNDPLKSYSQLEKHCISLEFSIQLYQELFQKHESCDNQNALEILGFFKNNDLKAQLQDKDTTICKLKELIKSMREKSKEENVNYAYCEIENKNVELENSVAKLLLENGHLCKEINHVKHVFKD